MNPAFAQVLAQNKQDIVHELAKMTKERAGPTYATVPLDQLLPRMALVFDAVHDTIAQDDMTILEKFIGISVQQRAEEFYALMEIQSLISILREIVLRLVEETYRDDPKMCFEINRDFEDLTHHSREWALNIFMNAYEERLERQRRVLVELSTPVIQVYENILVLPLVGAIDTERARRVMEELLVGITDHQAELVIIDITGVPVVDTSVANHLIQTIKAARLLGARSILVGISSEIAQTLVHLRIDLSGVETRSNLQAGIEHALEQMGLEIAPLIEPLPSESEEGSLET